MVTSPTNTARAESARARGTLFLYVIHPTTGCEKQINRPAGEVS